MKKDDLREPVTNMSELINKVKIPNKTTIQNIPYNLKNNQISVQNNPKDNQLPFLR